MSALEELTTAIKKAKSITFLTGAGVSTASGIPDFRSTSGLWTADRSREYYMSRGYFTKHPFDFWKKYKEIFRVKLLKHYQPNSVHQFIKKLENMNKNIAVVTQNVDGLHQMAGNKDVVEYHGNVSTATCPSCGKTYSLEYILREEVPTCNRVHCQDILKPDIVLYGDPITLHHEAEYRIAMSDLVIVLGTSLAVTPFSLLPQFADQKEIPLAIINKEPTVNDELFQWVIHTDLLKAIQLMQQVP